MWQDAAQLKVKTLEENLEKAKVDEAKTSQKLQSFQQVNRSQTALVRGELQKTRKKLAHMQSVAQRLRDQAAWFQSKSPNLSLPEELRSLPTEEDAAEDHAELVQLHERWEKDVAQLAAELSGRPGSYEDNDHGLLDDTKTMSFGKAERQHRRFCFVLRTRPDSNWSSG
eukprot:g22797.t1